jgi:hypothetical protein
MTVPSKVIRTGVFKDKYKIGETNTVFGTYDTWAKNNPEGIIWVHGSGEVAMTVFQFQEEYILLSGFGEKATAVSGDYGFQTWGNNIVVDAIDAMINYIEAEFGVVSPIVITGASMGGCGSLNYLRVHPERVKAAALIIPLINMNYIYPIAPGDIDAAYPPDGWSEPVYGTTHNPLTFAPTLDPDVPIHLWCASDDPLCPITYAQQFVLAAPNAKMTNLGPGGHTQATIAKATAPLLEWILPFLEA